MRKSSSSWSRRLQRLSRALLRPSSERRRPSARPRTAKGRRWCAVRGFIRVFLRCARHMRIISQALPDSGENAALTGGDLVNPILRRLLLRPTRQRNRNNSRRWLAQRPRGRSASALGWRRPPTRRRREPRTKRTNAGHARRRSASRVKWCARGNLVPLRCNVRQLAAVLMFPRRDILW